jgi:hypothetical protein
MVGYITISLDWIMPYVPSLFFFGILFLILFLRANNLCPEENYFRTKKLHVIKMTLEITIAIIEIPSLFTIV